MQSLCKYMQITLMHLWSYALSNQQISCIDSIKIMNKTSIQQHFIDMLNFDNTHQTFGKCREIWMIFWTLVLHGGVDSE